jgi:transposase InsO family protein
VAPFESLPAAHEAIGGWVHTYNHARPHQSLGMATPATLFRPHGPSRDNALPRSAGAAASPPAEHLRVG